MKINWKRVAETLFGALAVCVAAAASTRLASASDVRSFGRVVFTQIPAAIRAGAQSDSLGTRDTEQLPLGARVALLDTSAPERGATNLTPDFASAGKPDVSFDGSRILFVGKRVAADRFGIWEMAPDGSGPHEVLRFDANCLKVVHLSTIYGIDTDQPVRQMAFVARAPGDALPSIFTSRMDGSAVRRITFAPGGAFDPCPLSDGRLLFRMGLGFGGADAHDAIPRAFALFTVNTDGADIFPFAGFETASGADVSEPCETPSGLIVYVETKQHLRAGSRLAAVARTESLHSHSVIVDQGGAGFRTPSALADGKLLVSYRSASAESYGISVVDPNADPQATLLFDDPMWDDMDAVVLGPHPEPAGRSSVVNYARQSGQLYCLNTYLSADGPDSRVPAGSIYGVRVWEFGDRVLDASTGPGATPGVASRQLRDTGTASGEFRVDPDGSFFLEVPAQTPLRLETLDESGRVLRGMRTWMWVMPGERRGCIGCHEDRELTPPNRHVLALRKRPQGVDNAAMLSPLAPKPPEKPANGAP